VNLLLDTHVLIWSQEDPKRLGRASRDALLDPKNRRCFHTISTLEIARLTAGGLLSFTTDPGSWIRGALAALHASTVELSHQDALGAYQLPPPFHKDPCDRILVSAARGRGMTLMTADERILAYRLVQSMDARK
jgi:PIN domain nuclease of toxin-antitoxin system